MNQWMNKWINEWMNKWLSLSESDLTFFDVWIDGEFSRRFWRYTRIMWKIITPISNISIDNSKRNLS
jgi:hypothetical protein